MDQRRHAAGEVAEIVREVGVVPRENRLVGEAGVLAEDHLAEHEVAERVEAEPLDVVLRRERRCPSTWTSSRLPSATSRG